MRIVSEVFKAPLPDGANPTLRELQHKGHNTREIGYALIRIQTAAKLEAAKGGTPLTREDPNNGLYGYSVEEAKRTMDVLLQTTGKKRDANSKALSMIAKSVKEMLYEVPEKSAIAAEKLLVAASVFASEIDNKPQRRRAKKP